MRLTVPTDFDILDALTDGERNNAANLAYLLDRDRSYINTRLPVLADYGLVERVGLSNFRPDQLETAIDRLDAPVAAHQVEMHPLLPQPDLHRLALDEGHQLVAYCPIARNEVADVPQIADIAAAHDATPAQMSLAWLHAKDQVTPIPRSSAPEHIRENHAALDLDLTPEEIATIDGIDRQHRIVDFDAAPWNQ